MSLPTNWVISSSFTISPLENHFDFYTSAFGISCKFNFSPYGQILQSLLTQHSVHISNDNPNNLSLVFIRQSDFEENDNYLEEFISALSNISTNNYSHLILIVCPSRYETSKDFIERLKIIPKINLLRLDKNADLYSNIFFLDEISDKNTHIPYTIQGYTEIGRSVFRYIYNTFKKPYKVIVVDCDNTLWDGACGETRVEDISLTKNNQFLQRFLIKKIQEGMLVCLCSKNIESDVLNVFNHNKKMLLSLSDITAHYINWDDKFVNIKKLSGILNLSLDSFIFIDDRKIECESVKRNIPEVLSIHLDTNRKWTEYITNVWAFDKTSITSEDKKRTSLYKDVFSRHKEEKRFRHITDFIESLNIKIAISDYTEENIERVSQLTYRVTQFNFTNLKWPFNLNHTNLENVKIKTISVKDRIGDYGLVGLIFYSIHNDFLMIENYLLSCRVLGKGIEHRCLREFIQDFEQNRFNYVKLKYIVSTRNIPARRFADSLPGKFHQNEEYYVFSFNDLANIVYTPEETSNEDNYKTNVSNEKEKNTSAIREIENNAQLKIAQLSSNIDNLIQMIYKKTVKDVVFHETLSVTEYELGKIFSQILPIDYITPQTSFFQSGGNSIQATYICSMIYRSLRKKVLLYKLYQYDTISALAKYVDTQKKIVYQPDEIPFIENINYLSSAQKRIFFLENLHKTHTPYNVFLSFICKGNIDSSLLKLAIKEIIFKNPELTCSFHVQKGEIEKKHHSSFDINIIEKQVSREKDDKNYTYMFDLISAKLNLGISPILKCYILRHQGEDSFILLFISHHIIMDGISWEIFIGQLSHNYNNLVNNTPDNNKPKENNTKSLFPYNYSSTVKYTSDDKTFWSSYLATYPEDFFINKSSHNIIAMDSLKEKIVLDNNLSTSVIKYSTVNHVSEFSIFSSALSYAIYKLTLSKDLVFGFISSGRNECTSSSIGMYAKTLLLRLKTSNISKLEDFIQCNSSVISDVIQHQNFPYEDIVSSFVPRSLRSPFEIMLVYQNYKLNSLNLSHIKTSRLELNRKTCMFDILIEIKIIDSCFQVTAEYNIALYDQKTINDLLSNFTYFLTQLSLSLTTAL